MGTIRPFNSIPPIEAEESVAPQLFVMPVPQLPLGGDDLPYPMAGKGGKLIYMPARWGAYTPAKSRRQYRGNAVECWPKGYPTHDDL
jgi:hypothetical protein